MLRRKIKTFCKLLLANILIFLVVGIVIEIGGQTYAYFHPAYKVIPFVPHPVLGWRFMPNTEHIITGNHWYAREFSSKVKINSHGFRDLERTIEKDKNTIRIALLGDSMVAARQLDFEKTAGQLLEKRLNKEFGPKTGKKYEVLNFGVPGYGVDQMFLNWDRYASKFNPDYVFLYVFEKNYLRTVSSVWCARGFLGIDNLGDKKCLNIRPFPSINSKSPVIFESITYLKISKLGSSKDFKSALNLLKNLKFEINLSRDINQFAKEQNKYLKKEMNDKRSIKKRRRLFLIDIFKKINFLKSQKKENVSKQRQKNFTGKTKKFQPFNLISFTNLKLIQELAYNFQNKRSNFTIVDSFQFHNESTPPTQFASKWLKILSEYSNFGYIPLYENLNKSNQNGNSPRWNYDAHLNELGNQIFADSMFDYLEKKLN